MRGLRRSFGSMIFAVTVLSMGSIGCRKRIEAKPEADLGKVVCWGLGRSGQIGNGKNEDQNAPSSVTGVDDATKLFLGSSMSCARVAAGLRCWGDDRTGTSSNVPRPFDFVSDVEDLRSSTLFSCALQKAGTVSCWGSNLVGQLGNGKARFMVRGPKGLEAPAPAPAGADSKTPGLVTGMTDAIAIALGGSHACALRREGTMKCWGSNSVGQLGDGKGGYNENIDHPIPVPGLTGVAEIAAGKRATCARTANSVYCWGTLSEEYPTDDSKPVLIPSPTKVEGVQDAVQIAVRETEACARSSTGDVICWGAAGKPAPAPVKHAVELIAGATHICARLDSGAVRCWGSNNNGQLGVVQSAPGSDTIPGVTSVIGVAAGSGHTCVLRKTK